MSKKAMILTGASRGIGHATARVFSDQGWRVITCSRHAFSSRCPWASGPDDHLQIDLSDPADRERGLAELRERIGDSPLHALVNNAGISPKAEGGARLGALDTAPEVWRRVFEVNFFAPIMLARGLIDHLKAGQGAIVNVTSIAGSRVHPFAGTAYATSKAALATLTREMASDFGPLGVRVNSIAPGEIETPILSPGSDKIAEALPLRRLGTTDEVARTIYFLCSDDSSYVHGAEVHIDGGQRV
ncbi:SDR family NAD(P)-dependent oxidoreductase [Gammaproteobacteria bacterium]|nr:SDR family NAD(P)-dependent oxidoreductase [Gammaproteobacteria bacterium]